MTSDPARAAGGLTAPGTGEPGQAGPPGGSVLDRPQVQGAGWVWGDAGAQVPPDAPLPALLSVAVRLLGAFIGSTMQGTGISPRSEEHTSELQSQSKLVCRLLLEKKK